MLSGIQHYKFCPRQWALIHIEQQWVDNKLTAEGHVLHKKVDDPSYREKNGDTITLRGLHISSKALGLYGIADAIELFPAKEGESAFLHPRYPGRWGLLPIEYKHGRKKMDERDEVQLAAQAICLEEMYNIEVEKGAFFYWETRTREYLVINEQLRTETIRCTEEMHRLFHEGKTPIGRNDKSCGRCSLIDVCCPDLVVKSDISRYLKKYLYEEDA